MLNILLFFLNQGNYLLPYIIKNQPKLIGCIDHDLDRKAQYYTDVSPFFTNSSSDITNPTETPIEV